MKRARIPHARGRTRRDVHRVASAKGERGLERDEKTVAVDIWRVNRGYWTIQQQGLLARVVVAAIPRCRCCCCRVCLHRCW